MKINLVLSVIVCTFRWVTGEDCPTTGICQCETNSGFSFNLNKIGSIIKAKNPDGLVVKGNITFIDFGQMFDSVTDKIFFTICSKIFCPI